MVLQSWVFYTLQMGHFLAKRHVYIEDNKVWVGGVPDYMNATITPENPLADTEFSYLTTDGSDDEPYTDSFTP